MEELKMISLFIIAVSTLIVILTGYVPLISSRLTTALNQKHLTQAELARKTHISRSLITYYVSGRNKPKKENNLKLAKALDVDPDWLAGADVDMTGKKIINFLENDNIYLDNQRLTLTERKEMANFARGFRVNKK